MNATVDLMWNWKRFSKLAGTRMFRSVIQQTPYSFVKQIAQRKDTKRSAQFEDSFTLGNSQEIGEFETQNLIKL